MPQDKGARTSRCRKAGTSQTTKITFATTACSRFSSALSALPAPLCPLAKQELKIGVSKLHRGFCSEFQRFFLMLWTKCAAQGLPQATALPSLWGQTFPPRGSERELHTKQLWSKIKAELPHCPPHTGTAPARCSYTAQPNPLWQRHLSDYNSPTCTEDPQPRIKTSLQEVTAAKEKFSTIWDSSLCINKPRG